MRREATVRRSCPMMISVAIDLDRFMVEVEQADCGVVHDLRHDANSYGERAWDVDADVLVREGSFERDVDRARGQVEKGISLDEGPYECAAAMVALDGFVSAHASIYDEDFIRRASLIEPC